MERIEIGSGSHLEFTSTLDKNITEYDNVFVAVYAGGYVVRGSYIERSGFNKLYEGSLPNIIIMDITNAQSANLVGDLFLEVKLIENGKAGDPVPKDTTITMVNNKLKSVL